MVYAPKKRRQQPAFIQTQVMALSMDRILLPGDGDILVQNQGLVNLFPNIYVSLVKNVRLFAKSADSLHSNFFTLPKKAHS